jgi:hypothetical protein
MTKKKTAKPIKAYVVVWDKKKSLNWSNIDQIVQTVNEARSISDISGDTEAQHNTPNYGYIKVLITPLK